MQIYLVLALLFSIGVAVFAVQNASRVEITLFFWQLKNISLVLVIFGSALIGALATGLFGLVKQLKLRKMLKQYKNQAETLDMEAGCLQRKLDELYSASVGMETEKSVNQSNQ
ncbi:LapA family protein [Phosphitispora sp. TUW77]|uniref:LapA family protein n=1 Tax=Phosphitispora sp. TUW77 TaxID=3152361 RepID=UPI003AB65F3E